MIKYIFGFKGIKLSFTALLFTFLFSIVTFGAVNISSDRKNVPLNEAFRLRVEFSDEPMENYSVEGLENFNVLGRSTSKSISIINFKRTSQETEDYLLRPKKVGDFELKVKSKSGTSNTISIEVSGNGSGASNIPITGSSSTTSGSNPKNNVVGQGANVPQNGNYAMISSFGDNKNRKFYFGEKFIFSETFLAFRSPRDFRIVKRAEFPDFTEKNLTPVGRGGTIMQSIIDYNGRQALEMPLYLGILQANSSGKKAINGYEVQILDNSYQYYGGENYSLEILPLPDGKPKNFKDIIGKLQLSSNFGRTEGNIGQPIILNLKLFGDVNLDNIDKLDIVGNENFTIYETLKNGMEDIVNGRYYAEKNFEIAFIPKKSGALETPEIKISFLNTSTGKYEEKIVQPQTLKIAGGTQTPTVNSSEDIKNSTITKAEDTKSTKMDSSVNSDKNNPVTVDFVVEESSKKGLDKRDYIIIALIFSNLVLILIVFYILKKDWFKIKKIDTTANLFKEMKKSKNDRDFYKNYCSYMKERYGFNPKIHSETKLKNFNLIEINRTMEEFRYRGIPFSKSEILKVLKDNE